MTNCQVGFAHINISFFNQIPAQLDFSLRIYKVLLFVDYYPTIKINKNSDESYAEDLQGDDFDKMKLISYCKFHSIIILAGALVRCETLESLNMTKMKIGVQHCLAGTLVMSDITIKINKFNG